MKKSFNIVKRLSTNTYFKMASNDFSMALGGYEVVGAITKGTKTTSEFNGRNCTLVVVNGTEFEIFSDFSARVK